MTSSSSSVSLPIKGIGQDPDTDLHTHTKHIQMYTCSGCGCATPTAGTRLPVRIRYLAKGWHHFGVSKALVVAHVGKEEGSIHQKRL